MNLGNKTIILNKFIALNSINLNLLALLIQTLYLWTDRKFKAWAKPNLNE